MSRKRARTSQSGPRIAATAAVNSPSLGTKSWQRDGNASYRAYTNTSTSGPSSKARRTSAGRIPINIPEASPDITIYEPAEYIQQAGTFTSPVFSSNANRQSNLYNNCIPWSSLEFPTTFPVSPTTTVSEGLTNNTPPTSVAMSRDDSLATSFCEAFGMVRASSGISEIDSGRSMHRQDSCYGAPADPFSPDVQLVGTPFDQSIYFAHAEGTAIEDSSASEYTTKELQLPTTLELDTDITRLVSTSSSPNVNQVQSFPSLNLHTKMVRDASSESTSSSASRVSRRSQEQIAQAARPIAPKDGAESPMRKNSSAPAPGSEEMCRHRSAPEPKVLIPKLPHSRRSKEKLKCDRCDKNPEGYRGSHELQRHMALDHDSLRTAWICVDISPDGFLSGCTACESKKPYGQDYNAAAHLRRYHFHPRSEVRRTNVDPEQRRGGKGGGRDPPISECRRWMKKITMPGKDFMALSDAAADDANNDAGEDGVNAQGEQGGQDKVVGNSFLTENVPTNGSNLQSQDIAVGQQISTSPLESSNSLELAMTSDRQLTFPTSDVSFRRSGLEAAFGASSATYFHIAASSFTPDMTYAFPTPSSSAPAAPSFTSSNAADDGPTQNLFVKSTPESLHLPSAMSTTTNAHILEDLSNLQTPYFPDNFSYGMSSPNNAQGAFEGTCGLLDFPTFH